MGIVIETPGLMTTVQDAGRFGYQEFGVSPAGPLDQRAFALANILVGNQPGTEMLEITFSGPTIRFEEDNIIAITGGDFAVELNDKAIPMYRATAVRRGDVLKVGMVSGGCRGYIAFAGGLDVQVVMNSKATLMRNKMGGVAGRKLAAGDALGFIRPQVQLPNMANRFLVPEYYPKKDVTLRVVVGPQDQEFSTKELRKFFWYSAEVTNEFDRMGCRLKVEEPLKHLKDGNIISDGISFGSIQVPTNGQPIIMLADRQSTGGYTKIGTVISVDLPKVAQSLPGYRFHFVQVSIQLAQQLYLRQVKELEELRKCLGAISMEI